MSKGSLEATGQLPVGIQRLHDRQRLSDQLLEDLVSFENDPEGFVLWAFPWGEAGTPLEFHPGPDDWQLEELRDMGRRLQEGGDNGCLIQDAFRSGHGVGKSAFLSWLILWALTTRVRTRGVVTAVTDTQLRTKTWAEASKWFSMFIARDLFDMQATSLSPKSKDLTLKREWRIDAVSWSKMNTSAFAGLHNQGKRLVVLFDEASEIDNIIYEVTRGALTDKDTQIIWLLFGQPTQTVGEFFHAFDKGEFVPHTLDSRNSRFSNKKLLQKWIDTYGEDSDFVRVRVKGLPPRAGLRNFIPIDLIKAARKRELAQGSWYQYPKRMGVDPAAFGDNLSVVTVRQGPKILGQWAFSGLDGPDLASRICLDIWPLHKEITGCAVDAIGIGADLCSALSRVKDFPLLRVNVAMPASDTDLYHNLRAELWGRSRKWLETAEIPDEDELEVHAVNLQYGFDAKSRFQLESKEDLKRRGLDSPDRWDSVALTFFEDTIIRVAAKKAVALPTRTRRAIVWGSR